MNNLYIRKKIFSKICKVRFFEFEVQKLLEKKIIKTLVYLSLGQESIAAPVSEAFKNAYVFNIEVMLSIYVLMEMKKLQMNC